jgi:superfamily II DNA or RNA helicase
VNYTEFLEQKKIIDMDSGFKVEDINKMLFPFQSSITKWALMRGRAAIFADTGLGKTLMQLVWACEVQKNTDKPVLVFAPLAVSKQTKREGAKFGIDVNICESQNEIINGINITNYEKLHKFKPEGLAGIVIDESSILKGFNGKFRSAITEFASTIPYRLACTATPAPNDLMEIINHAEFLGIMKQKEITGLFFIQDGNVTHKWRLKNHAEEDFYKWLASWAVAIRKPSDLGFSDEGYNLPPLNINQVEVKSDFNKGSGQMSLFPEVAKTLQERQKARRLSTNERVNKCANIINGSSEQWLVWCDMNAESTALKKMVDGSVEVTGSDKDYHKESSMIGFQNGEVQKLISKPSICGFGMNWQNCNKMVFVGLSDSFEKMYQAIRRCWRFGQDKPVDVYIITSDAEGSVIDNIKRKEKHVLEMMDNLIKHMNLHGQIRAKRDEMPYNPYRVLELPLFMRGYFK